MVTVWIFAIIFVSSPLLKSSKNHCHLPSNFIWRLSEFEVRYLDAYSLKKGRRKNVYKLRGFLMVLLRCEYFLRKGRPRYSYIFMVKVLGAS